MHGSMVNLEIFLVPSLAKVLPSALESSYCRSINGLSYTTGCSSKNDGHGPMETSPILTESEESEAHLWYINVHKPLCRQQCLTDHLT